LTEAVNLTEGFFEWLKIFLSFSFLYIAVLIIGKNYDGIFILTKTIIVTAMILALIGICQHFHLAFTNIPGNGIVYATMAHKNLFSSSLFLTVPYVLYGSLRFPGGWRIASFVSMVFIFLGLVITETRAVWAGIAFSTAITGMIVALVQQRQGMNNSIEKPMRSHRHRIFCISLILFGIITTATVSTYRIMADNKNHGGLVQSTPVWSLDSLNERMLLWQKSYEMINDNKILGVGLGQWKIALAAYGKIEKTEASHTGIREILFQRPHNDFIWILSEAGILGLICHLSFFFTIIFYIVRIVGKTKDTDRKVFSIFMLFGIVGYMIISFFSFPKERIFHQLFLMLITAGVVCEYHRLYPIKRKVVYPKVLSLNISLPILLAVCILFGYARLESEIHSREALSARKAKHWDRVIHEINKADSWYYNMDPVSTPLSWYRGMANFSLGRISEALKDFKRASEIHPNHIHVLNNLGTCYALREDYPKARDYYQRTLAVSPGYREARVNLKNISTFLTR